MCNPYSLFFNIAIALAIPIFVTITQDSISKHEWSIIYSLMVFLIFIGILGSPTITMNESGITINRYFYKSSYPLRNIKSVTKEKMWYSDLMSEAGPWIGIIIHLKTGKKVSINSGKNQANIIVKFYESHLV